MQISDLDIQAREIQRMRDLMEEILARHTGQTIEQVRADVERDKIFTAEQAKEYGIVDEVITYPQARQRAESGCRAAPRPLISAPTRCRRGSVFRGARAYGVRIVSAGRRCRTGVSATVRGRVARGTSRRDR